MKGKLDHDDFTEEAIRDKQILQLAKEVTYRYRDDSDPPSWPQHAFGEVWVTSGKRTLRESSYARGTRENPSTFSDVKDKFVMNTSGILSAETQTSLVNAVEKLDHLSDCGEIFKIIHEESSI